MSLWPLSFARCTLVRANSVLCINRYWPQPADIRYHPSTERSSSSSSNDSIFCTSTRNGLQWSDQNKKKIIKMKVFVVLSVLALAAAKPQGYSYNQPSFGGSSLGGGVSSFGSLHGSHSQLVAQQHGYAQQSLPIAQPIQFAPAPVPQFATQQLVHQQVQQAPSATVQKHIYVRWNLKEEQTKPIGQICELTIAVATTVQHFHFISPSSFHSI